MPPPCDALVCLVSAWYQRSEMLMLWTWHRLISSALPLADGAYLMKGVPGIIVGLFVVCQLFRVLGLGTYVGGTAQRTSLPVLLNDGADDE